MPRFSRAVLLYNANAGQSQLEEVLSLSVPPLAEASGTLELIQTDSLEEFEIACRKAAESAEVLFVAGGDGTIHETVKILTTLNSPPILGILPSGTCNDFARTLEIPLALEEAAAALAAGHVCEVDTATANGSSFLNFAGIGLITDISTNIDPQLKERYGKLGYFISGLQVLRQTAPFSVRLTVDDVLYEEDVVLLLIMNGCSVGTHHIPLASLDPADGLLDVFLIQASSLAMVMEWFSLGQPDAAEEELEHITHLKGRHITVDTEEEKKVDTDGETYLRTPLEVTIHPHRLNMLIPKKSEG